MRPERTNLETRAAAVPSPSGGDDREWETFFDENDGLILSVVSWPKWRFQPQVREDLAQTIRSEIVRCLGNLRERGHARPFVLRICVNRCIDEVRRQVRERQLLQPLAVQDPDGEWREMDLGASADLDPVTAVVMTERAAMLTRLLERLDEGCLRFIRQFYSDGLRYKEIARREGIAVNTVGSRLSRCLEKLRTMSGVEPDLREPADPPGRRQDV
jgi:RNA polymerase sigma factor (sigma-70 family)